MEDFIAVLPKLIEYGPLGIINILLIFKGIPAMNNLTNSISKLADKIDTVDDRIIVLERDIHDCLHEIKSELNHLKSQNRKQYEEG